MSTIPYSHNSSHSNLECPSIRRSANRLVTLILTIGSHDIEPLHTHRIRGEAAEVVTDNNNKVGQHQDAALEVVALSFSIHVAQQEHAQDNRHHIPLREQEGEGVQCRITTGRNTWPERRVKDERGDLKQADLQSVG